MVVWTEDEEYEAVLAEATDNIVCQIEQMMEEVYRDLRCPIELPHSSSLASESYYEVLSEIYGQSVDVSETACAVSRSA